MDTLFVIPARGGSKGIPGKNIRLLNSKPLIQYSIEYALQFVPASQICISTDSREIAKVAGDCGVPVSFIRPEQLASDHSGTYEVLMHALEHHQPGKEWKNLVLLQPTSPFREKRHLEEAMAEMSDELDMVVSVSLSKNNPYFNLFEEDKEGFLQVSKKTEGITRRQDAPEVYAYNGSIYIIRVGAFFEYPGFASFQKIRKYVMEPEYSIDLDTPRDWAYAEFLFSKEFLH